MSPRPHFFCRLGDDEEELLQALASQLGLRKAARAGVLRDAALVLAAWLLGRRLPRHRFARERQRRAAISQAISVKVASPSPGGDVQVPRGRDVLELRAAVDRLLWLVGEAEAPDREREQAMMLARVALGRPAHMPWIPWAFDCHWSWLHDTLRAGEICGFKGLCLHRGIGRRRAERSRAA